MNSFLFIFVLIVAGSQAYGSKQPVIKLPGDKFPLDYEYFRGVGYYKFYGESQTWEQARRICESEGAYLMIVNSQSEVTVLRQFMARGLQITRQTFPNHFYMGFSDHESEGHFITLLGELLSTSGYNVWLPGAPHNEPRANLNTDSDCGCINTNMQLDDAPCSGQLPFWCEMPQCAAKPCQT